MSIDLPPEAAALRDRAVSPLLALLEQQEIADAFERVEIEHSRSLHPSSFPDPQIGTDMDQIDAGEVFDFVIGNEYLICDLPVCCYIRHAGEEFTYMGMRGQLAECIPRDSAVVAKTWIEGETVVSFAGDLF